MNVGGILSEELPVLNGPSGIVADAVMEPGDGLGGVRQPCVSVVLPVYNVEPYIGKCIESLRAQTMDELEFVFVDDCSTDSSMASVEEWAAQDNRVRVLRNEQNMGSVPSRNRGIEIARGDYLSFIDPDDYVSPDFYELLYVAAIADGGHDIAKGLRVEHWPDGHIARNPSIELNSLIYSASQGGEPLYEVFIIEHQTAIYRREIMGEGARFGADPYAYSAVWLFSAVLRTEDTVIDEYAEYHHVRWPDSPVEASVFDCFIGKPGPLAEMAAALVGALDVRGARSSLKDKACRRLLDGYCMACLGDFSLNEKADVDMQKLAQALVSSPVLQLPPGEDLAIRALAEKGVGLPYIDRLGSEQMTAGALRWVDFIGRHPDVASRYVDECARGMAEAIRLGFARSGRTGFAGVCSQLAEKTVDLPASQRTTLWLKAFRRLATKRNLGAVAKGARRKTNG